LEIAFVTRNLRDLCSRDEVASSELGEGVTECLKKRLADIMAALNIEEILAGRQRIVTVDGQEFLKLDLTQGFVMTMEPAHHQARRTSSGNIDWKRVRRVKLISIEEEI